MTLQQKAVELASTKIKASPRQYELYISDEELFNMLVDDCRKQIAFMDFTTYGAIAFNQLNQFHDMEAMQYEQNIV